MVIDCGLRFRGRERTRQTSPSDGVVCRFDSSVLFLFLSSFDDLVEDSSSEILLGALTGSTLMKDLSMLPSEVILGKSSLWKG